jgi:hypothetical protein
MRRKGSVMEAPCPLRHTPATRLRQLVPGVRGGYALGMVRPDSQLCVFEGTAHGEVVAYGRSKWIEKHRRANMGRLAG